MTTENTRPAFFPRIVFGHVKLYNEANEVVATFNDVALFEAVVEMSFTAYENKMRGRAAGNEYVPAFRANVD